MIAPSLPRNEHYTQNTLSMNEWINREVLIFLIYLFYFIFLLSSGSLRHVVLKFPNQTLNPHLLQWIHWVLTTGLPGCPHRKAFKMLSEYLKGWGLYWVICLSDLGHVSGCHCHIVAEWGPRSPSGHPVWATESKEQLFPSQASSLLVPVCNRADSAFCSWTLTTITGFPVVKEYICRCKRHRRRGFYPWDGGIPWSRKWQTTPVFLPGKSHGEEPGVLQFRGSQRTGHDWSWTHNNNNKNKISSFASGNVDGIDSGRWGIFPYLVMRLVLPRVQNVPHTCSSLSISKYILGNDGGHAPPWLSTRLL